MEAMLTTLVRHGVVADEQQGGKCQSAQTPAEPYGGLHRAVAVEHLGSYWSTRAFAALLGSRVGE